MVWESVVGRGSRAKDVLQAAGAEGRRRQRSGQTRARAARNTCCCAGPRASTQPCPAGTVPPQYRPAVSLTSQHGLGEAAGGLCVGGEDGAEDGAAHGGRQLGVRLVAVADVACALGLPGGGGGGGGHTRGEGGCGAHVCGRAGQRRGWGRQAARGQASRQAGTRTVGSALPLQSRKQVKFATASLRLDNRPRGGSHGCRAGLPSAAPAPTPSAASFRRQTAGGRRGRASRSRPAAGDRQGREGSVWVSRGRGGGGAPEPRRAGAAAGGPGQPTCAHAALSGWHISPSP